MSSPPQSISVAAPGRLHFGMFAVGDLVERQFGGIGLMVDQPQTIIEATAAERFSISGHEHETCRNAATGWFENLQVARQLATDPSNNYDRILLLDDLPVQLLVRQSSPRHFGLGSGTQLALTTAMALNEFFQLAAPSVEELSVAVGRAKRSAIGSYGFFEGGFLVDHGKAPHETIAGLDFQVDFPTDWPIVLIYPDQAAGLAGEQEAAAFARIPPTTTTEQQTMIDLVQHQIVPGVVQADYHQFSEGLYEFGYRSGLYFESVQGGAYNGPVVQQLVQHVREFGVAATGQTSWGPCVFAIVEHADQAKRLADSIRAIPGQTCRVEITHADNAGAKINGVANLSGQTSVVNRLQS